MSLKMVLKGLMLITVSLLLTNTAYSIDSSCRGASKSQCGKYKRCVWIKGFKKLGTKVNSYCRSLPKKARKVSKRIDKNIRGAKRPTMNKSKKYSKKMKGKMKRKMKRKMKKTY